MWLRDHLLFTIIPAVIMAFFSPIYALVFFLAGIMIDLDHLFLLKKEKLNLNPMKQYYSLVDESKKRSDIGGTVVLPFHLIEIWLVLLLSLLFFYNNYVLVIAAGGFYHMTLDALHWQIKLKKMKAKRKRIFSFVQYLYCKKNAKSGLV